MAPTYTWKENGEANAWIILKDTHWFMSIRINGEIMETNQKDILQQMVDSLNLTIERA